MKLPLSDRLSKWSLDRYLFVQDYLNDHAKGRAGNRGIPLGTVGDKPSGGETVSTHDAVERKAMTLSWIYSDVQLMAGEISAADIEVLNNKGEIDTPVRNHPFELLFRFPNRFMGQTYLMQYTTTWMMLNGNGYWYLAPTKRNRSELAELWPLYSSKMKVVKDKDKFISHYLYKLDDTTVVKIDPSLICHFQFPNPFDQTDGLSKLSAAYKPMRTEFAASDFQQAFYETGSGVPRSVLSLDRDISDRDFNAVEAKIHEDFVRGSKTIAVVRAGEFNVRSVGLSQSDMQLVSSRTFSRDEIDRVMLGVEYSRLQTEGSIRQADKMLREKGVYPLHRLLAEQITLQILRRFYDENTVCRFEDIRLRDRAIEVQEAAVYWRKNTLNETRAQRGEEPLKGKIGEIDLEKLGQLPLALANDPVFVMTLFGMETQGPSISSNSARNREEERRQIHQAQNPQPDAPSLEDSEAPTLASERLAEQDSAVSDKAMGLAKADLKRWFRVASKEVEEGANPGDYPFVSEHIPMEVYIPLKEALNTVRSKEMVKEVFDKLGYAKLELLIDK